jgi:hypothetical protein
MQRILVVEDEPTIARAVPVRSVTEGSAVLPVVADGSGRSEGTGRTAPVTAHHFTNPLRRLWTALPRPPDPMRSIRIELGLPAVCSRDEAGEPSRAVDPESVSYIRNPTEHRHDRSS